MNQAITELQALHNYPAENVLPLLAFSFVESMETDPCLVYLYMPNGSVADRLRCRGGTEPLGWDRRANIALGTSRGLCHLHANNIIHGDIKSGNILLDRHYEAKIGDFGLARGGPESDEFSYKTVSSVQGTLAYLPCDYVRSRHLTPAVDTFCFGILLHELVSGKSPSFTDPATNNTMRDILLGADNLPEPWVDPAVARVGPWPHHLFRLGKDCARLMRRQRPDMSSVLSAMEALCHHVSCGSLQDEVYDRVASPELAPPGSKTLNPNLSQNSAAGPEMIPTVLATPKPSYLPTLSSTSLNNPAAASTGALWREDLATISSSTFEDRDSIVLVHEDTTSELGVRGPAGLDNSEDDNSSDINNDDDDPKDDGPRRGFLGTSIDRGVPELGREASTSSGAAALTSFDIPDLPDVSLLMMGGAATTSSMSAGGGHGPGGACPGGLENQLGRLDLAEAAAWSISDFDPFGDQAGK